MGHGQAVNGPLTSQLKVVFCAPSVITQLRPPVGSGGGYECLPGEVTVEHDLGEEEPGLVGGLEDIEVGGNGDENIRIRYQYYVVF